MSDQPELPPKPPEVDEAVEKIHRARLEAQEEARQLTKEERQVRRIQCEVMENSSGNPTASAEAQLRAAQRQEVVPPTVQEIPQNEEIKLEDLVPNTTYKKNGYTYKIDELRRPEVISGELKLKEGSRDPKLQSEIGKFGDEGDEGGHLIGTRFDGPADAFNLVPQNANLNRGEWKAMENEWAKAKEDGKKVEVQIKPLYYDNSKRPEYFAVTYKIDGIDHPLRFFENMSAKEGGFSL